MKVAHYNPFWDIEFFAFARKKAVRRAKALNQRPVKFSAQYLRFAKKDEDDEYYPQTHGLHESSEVFV